jgi:hypothetical protein
MGIASATGAESFLSTSNPSRSEAQPSDSYFTTNGFRAMRVSDLSASARDSSWLIAATRARIEPMP